jgi:trk system potassium uptake protein TrkA
LTASSTGAIIQIREYYEGKEELVKQFIVVGLGRFGSSVALTLYKMGHDVLVMDKNEVPVQELSSLVTHAVQADATDEAVLRSLGIRNFDVAVIAIGNDIEASILATSLVKGMGVKKVVAKAQNDLHGRILEKVGADRIIYPEREMGVRLAKYLAGTNILDYIELSPDFSILEVQAPFRLSGKSLRDLNLRARHGITVVAIRHGDEIKVSPGADDTILDGDILVVVGETVALERWEEGLH